MIFQYNATKLPFRRRLFLSLSAIYGIGAEKALYVINTLGLNAFYPAEDLNSYFFECILIIFKANYVLDNQLSHLIKQRLLLFVNIKINKGRRMIRGLPIHGQRTHSNGKTPKRFKLIV